VENVSGSVDVEIRKVEALAAKFPQVAHDFRTFSAPVKQHRLQAIEVNRPYLSIEEKARDD
jgi:hypothetical protein